MAASSKCPAIGVHYACPCTDISQGPTFEAFATTEDIAEEQQIQSPEEDDSPFNPHSPRANFALYPLEHLLFCTECCELRCPRCYYEEALSYYCPSCLQDRTSTSVKTESNRCPQSCHQCPVCSSSLVVNRYADVSGEDVNQDPKAGPFILSCPYCAWTSLDADIQFKHRVNISNQLKEALIDRKQGRDSSSESASKYHEPIDHFVQLADFYKAQIEETGPNGSAGSRYPASPGHLSRLLQTRNFSGLRRQTKPVSVMREALTLEEGLQPIRLQSEDNSDDEVIARMANLGWSSTTSFEQRSRQSSETRSISDVLPVATQLHSRRAKRCRTCRNNLARASEVRPSPSSSSSSSRYRIRLVASSYIPRLHVKPLTVLNSSSVSDPSTSSVAGEMQRAPSNVLQPGKTLHYLLTFRNPLYHLVKVTLATPRLTPGTVASRVTILSPSFDLPGNKDIWEDASTSISSHRNRNAGPSLTTDTTQQPPEAGKVWASDRNATTIVVEVVPGILPISEDTKTEEGKPAKSQAAQGEVVVDKLMIPVFVRLEWDTSSASGSLSTSTTKAGAVGTSLPNISVSTPTAAAAATTKEASLQEDARIAGLGGDVEGDGGAKELAYWCVLDLGRIK